MKKSELYAEYKDLEQSYMVLRDNYSALARALGFEGDAWFGDPFASHEEIMARAIACHSIAMEHGIGGVEHM